MYIHNIVCVCITIRVTIRIRLVNMRIINMKLINICYKKKRRKTRRRANTHPLSHVHVYMFMCVLMYICTHSTHLLYKYEFGRTRGSSPDSLLCTLALRAALPTTTFVLQAWEEQPGTARTYKVVVDRLPELVAVTALTLVAASIAEISGDFRCMLE